VCRAAHVADLEQWLNELDVGPVRLVGQSLGAHTAFLTAARHGNLVSALVVAESTPAAGPDFSEAVRSWLESWPVPFRSREAAITFFGGDTLWARGWMSGLQSSPDGLMPGFDVDVMVASLDEVAETSYWEDWSNVRAPTLVVRAENGVPRDAVLRMIEAQPRAQLVEIAKAKHDVHLDKPIEWRKAVDAFLQAQTRVS
jgi:pimeloyl-ACP methyl ester carboxylesterase